jgi:acetyltransferase-like isoleucine patch superfamily enzyme
MIQKIIAKIKSIFLYPFQFGTFCRSSRIDSPLKLDGKKNIFVGDNVLIQKYTWLAAVPLIGDSAKLEIGNNSVIGHFNHIYATKSIVIEDYVLTADRVYITDNLHQYDNPNVPIILQPIKQISPVRIGEGSWLGENVCVIGANIGKHCVIGANSVVTHDIPDYSIAVGVPAKVIKKYNFETKVWEKVN